MLQQHAQPTSALYTRHTASGTSTSCDAEAALHQPYVGFPAGQQLPAAGHDAQSRPTAELSGEGGLKQPNRKQGSSEPGRWGIQLPVAEATAECHGAVRLQASAHTPQELADHLDKLKKEFRQIYSTILDGDAKLTSTAAVVVSLHVNLGGPGLHDKSIHCALCLNRVSTSCCVCMLSVLMDSTSNTGKPGLLFVQPLQAC